MDNKILEVDGIENNSCIGRDSGGEPPALSEYGKELVVVSDLLTATFPKKDSCTCC